MECRHVFEASHGSQIRKFETAWANGADSMFIGNHNRVLRTLRTQMKLPGRKLKCRCHEECESRGPYLPQCRGPAVGIWNIDPEVIKSIVPRITTMRLVVAVGPGMVSAVICQNWHKTSDQTNINVAAPGKANPAEQFSLQLLSQTFKMKLITSNVAVEERAMSWWRRRYSEGSLTLKESDLGVLAPPMCLIMITRVSRLRNKREKPRGSETCNR
ncbi:uncharacterized protein EI90DRAFT_3066841 [Cantharellus anzutake]|uniref:uncharacterized protein n=1 Tax=Cantharellus anzutake TaxID=1750568 RepID=UPI00190340B6|nr:uncharacterized protein EI90DRAFT_3066841 [Cantharellus anzutake]KAF8327733.1 hypothetical protein EI90DRAFT_3066841 [Cantharellus anzutake]